MRGFRQSAGLMALLVDWESKGMCMISWVFLEMIVLSRLCCVFWCRGKGRVNEEDDVLVVNGMRGNKKG